MSIEQLPDELINQIAAGEVIENPAGVVKELVENSIDAGAKQIDIELEQAGFKKIVIKDNGVGITKDDLILAPKRHATSKIKSFDDLYSINTMGFRGEALASIFGVAKAKIQSKHIESKESYEISTEHLEVKESSSSQGTIITVESLFHNTPARKKYLKSENLELKAILDTVKQFELVYFDTKINLKHNGKILVNKPAFKNVEENILYVLGKELKDNLFNVGKDIPGLEVRGFIGNPSTITYSTAKNQFLFVNNRAVKSKVIRDAIYKGFGTNLMEGRHPVFVIYIFIDAELIDVNVHPKKHEIKFENEKEVYEVVESAVRGVFEQEEIFKPFETKEKDTQLTPGGKKKATEEKTYYTKDNQQPLNFQEEIDEYLKEEASDVSIDDTWKESEEEVSYGPLYETLKEYRIVGQVNKTFVILETPKEMIVVDQHVAEEKFYFETFKEQLENKEPQSQSLLKPEVLKLTPQEFLLFEEYKEMISQLGFEAEAFGNSEVMVRKVPIGIKGKLLEAGLLKDILDEVSADNKFVQLEEDAVEKLASMSCKRSIKAGHEMTTPEIRKMIENLKRLKEPFNCPHGRPILLQYKFSDLEKKFKRIV